MLCSSVVPLAYGWWKRMREPPRRWTPGDGSLSHRVGGILAMLGQEDQHQPNSPFPPLQRWRPVAYRPPSPLTWSMWVETKWNEIRKINCPSTWGWADNDWVFIFGWTYPLRIIILLEVKRWQTVFRTKFCWIQGFKEFKSFIVMCRCKQYQCSESSISFEHHQINNRNKKGKNNHTFISTHVHWGRRLQRTASVRWQMRCSLLETSNNCCSRTDLFFFTECEFLSARPKSPPESVFVYRNITERKVQPLRLTVLRGLNKSSKWREWPSKNRHKAWNGERYLCS